MSFVINVTYDRGVNNAPTGFKATINSVIQFFESHFNNPVTINIAVGYGEIGGHRLSSGALGQSSYSLASCSYSDLTTAIANHATSADDQTAVANLPSYDPTGGTYWVTQAQAKALGLMGPSSSLDGCIGFAAGNKFTYNTSHGVAAGHYDFFGVVAHEISEVMGRCLLVGQSIGSTPNGYSLLDLFHYSSAVTPDFIGTKPGYFSIDGGHTNLANFNTQTGGDFGDWATSAGKDGFRAFAPSGVVNAVSLTDLRELDVLGWDRTNTSLAPTQHAKSHHVKGHSGHHKAVGGHANASEAGADQFIFRSPNDGAANIDTATDFNGSQGDKIDAAHAVLPALGEAGARSHMDPRGSHASPTGSAHFSTDHHYERTGALFHDPDGAGHAAEMQFDLAASDFLIV